MNKNILLITAFLTFALPCATYADNKAEVEVKAPIIEQTLKIRDGWARKSISPNNNSAAYMKITNLTDKDINIIGASAAEIANNVELHESFIDEKGISRMSAINEIVVPAKTEIELAEGRIHIMLLNLKRSLQAGDKFKIEIKIKDNIPFITEVEVK